MAIKNFYSPFTNFQINVIITPQIEDLCSCDANVAKNLKLGIAIVAKLWYNIVE